MKNLIDTIDQILLMGPGPSCVPPEVYRALSQKTIGHLDPYFLKIMDAVRCPKGIDELAIRRRLLDEFRIEIGGGLGPLAGKIWRIGLMGHTAMKDNVVRLLEALKVII